MGERIIEVVLKPKMYSYLTHVGYVDKKAVGTKRCIIKRKIKDYKKCTENNEKILWSQQSFRGEAGCSWKDQPI